MILKRPKSHFKYQAVCKNLFRPAKALLNLFLARDYDKVANPSSNNTNEKRPSV